MLNFVSKKLCPFLTVAIASLGCGKQITEDTSESARIIQNQELPNSLILNLDSQNGLRLDYEIPQNANIVMPETLLVSMNNTDFKQVTIKYNLDPISEEYDYECTYGSSTSLNELTLKKCLDYFGEIITSTSDFELPIYFQKTIRMELSTPQVNLNVKAVYLVDWK
jgi:hypothetical protein